MGPMLSLRLLSILLMAFIFNACNGTGTATFSAGHLGSGGGFIFSGISSIDLKTDTSLRINWPSHPDAVSYDIYDVTSGSVYVDTVSAPATSYALTSLTPGGTYSFWVRAKNASGLFDGNTQYATVTMNNAPDAPTALTLITPASSPGLTGNPVVRVSGVKDGDGIKLFSDSSCTTQVASGVATGATVDLTTSTLPPGSYTFYANASNSVPNASACSTASLAYQRNFCPTNYITVPGNATVGTASDFCAMKFEAKCVGSTCASAPNAPGATAVATSQATSKPWSQIDQINAKVACTNLGTGYDLMSNPEWMTIARNLETNAVNWSGGSVGSGTLSTGHIDLSPAASLPVTDELDPYDGTGNSSGSGWEQKRTMTLSNGEVIWDLTGNVSEWIDWTLGGPLDKVAQADKAYVSADGGPSASARELKDLDMNIASGDVMDPITWQPADPTLTSAQNIGVYYAGTSGGATLRGSNYNNGSLGGIYRFGLNNAQTYKASTVGFRCVYRP